MYTLVMLVVATFAFVAGELSIGFTVFLTAAVFGLFTWHVWRRSRRRAVDVRPSKRAGS